jgi:hypothetical protein
MTAKPGGIPDVAIELVEVARKSIRHQLHLLAQPSQRSDGPQWQRLEPQRQYWAVVSRSE